MDELARLETGVLRRGLKAGRVHPQMTRADVRRLRETDLPALAHPFQRLRTALKEYQGDREALRAWLRRWRAEHDGPEEEA